MTNIASHNNVYGDYPPDDSVDPTNRVTGDQPWLNDELVIYPEVNYPDGAMPYPNDHGNDTWPSATSPAPTPLTEDPQKYFVRPLLKKSPIDELWQCKTFRLGGGQQPILVMAPNDRRCLITWFTDANNSSPVFLTNSPASSLDTSTGVSVTSIALRPGCDPFYMRHTGQVFAYAANDAILYLYAENYA